MPLSSSDILPAKKSFASELGVGINKGVNDYFDEQKQSRINEQKAKADMAKALGVQQSKNQGKLDLSMQQLQMLGYGSQKGDFKDQLGEPKMGKNQTTSSQGDQSSFSKLMDDPENIPDELIAKSAALGMKPFSDALSEAKNRALKEKKESPDYQRNIELSKEQAKSDFEFYNKLLNEETDLIGKEESLKRLDVINDKNETGRPIDYFAEKLGFISKTPEGRREMSAELKNLYIGFKDVVGSQMSASEFFTLTNQYPSPDFPKEINKAIIDNIREAYKLKNKKIEIAKNLKKENKGKIPPDLQERVNDEWRNYALERGEVVKRNTRKIMKHQYKRDGYQVMFDPNDPSGEPLLVPDNPQDIENALSLGAESE